MNETNPWETQLRSWTPRRPSAGLERRLFRRPSSTPRPAHWLNWLVPATACLLFACLVLNQQGAAHVSATPRAGTMVALILSNQSYAAYLPGSFQRSVNRLDTFGWTNGGSSTSSMHSLSPIKAND
jgi:hypothetical protein